MTASNTPRAAAVAVDTDRAYGLDPVLETGVDRRFSPVTKFVSVPCPYCGGSYDSAIDLTLGVQQYIEDCQVCCRSIELGLDVVDGALQGVTARRIDGV